MRLILASASPRRKDLLKQLNLDFDIIVSDIEEEVSEYISPEETAKSLAYQKAKNVAKKVKDNCLILSSDTMVVIDNTILGKPESKEDVHNMLKMLSGREHRVITSVCLIKTESNDYLLQNDISEIKMRDIYSHEIEAYIETGEPFDKAGSYAIQGLGSVFVEQITGSYSSIVGLPIFTLDKMLKYFGVNILNFKNNKFI